MLPPISGSSLCISFREVGEHVEDRRGGWCRATWRGWGGPSYLGLAATATLAACIHMVGSNFFTFNIAAFLPSDLHLVIFPAPKHSKNYASGLLLPNVAVRLSNSQ
jgi:hypothetical protein